jgi:hypothetical protein
MIKWIDEKLRRWIFQPRGQSVPQLRAVLIQMGKSRWRRITSGDEIKCEYNAVPGDDRLDFVQDI